MIVCVTADIDAVVLDVAMVVQNARRAEGHQHECMDILVAYKEEEREREISSKEVPHGPQGIKKSFLSQLYWLSLAGYLGWSDILQVICAQVSTEHEGDICLGPLSWCLS